MVTFLPSRYNLCADVGGIIVGGYVTSEAFTHGLCFPDCMVADCIRFLLQDGLGMLGIVNHGHVIPIDT